MTPTPPHPAVDPERTGPLNAFDTPTGHSGQEYDRTRDAAAQTTPPVRHEQGQDDLPPEAGHRTIIAPNGEARGMGAGGGAPEVPQAGAAPDRQ